MFDHQDFAITKQEKGFPLKSLPFTEQQYH